MEAVSRVGVEVKASPGEVLLNMAFSQGFRSMPDGALREGPLGADRRRT